MRGREITRGEVLAAAVVVGLGVVAVAVVAGPARQRKRSGHCSSNLKQLGMAMLQYTQDYDDTLPRAWFGRNAGPSDKKVSTKWMDVLFPYAKSESLFVCPADDASKPYRFRDGDS